ncbi:Asp-tRNA(Asn)/Glu-tRNA(Gln) amidotransferase subunit GatA [Poriferisphaera corsica]|nr:Asp-tRNA(Asn)/Glu-tRNA(Gln) amidotransferase subunit GatA [Poriferisphaera corsica]
MDITKTTLSEVREAVTGKEVSAVEMTQAYLDRIAKYDGKINAYRETYDERALERAKLVDEGKIEGPLAGVPIAIKDLMCTEYGKTCCSSKMLAKFEAFYNSTAVKRLEDAGAIVLGKTNMDEFAMGSSTETCAFGATKNPWDTDYVPGGSSGGAAAAMAADFCAGSLGSDTGGSIRQPASLCGVTGLKPTYGRVSRWGLVAFASSLDQIGPFGHSVKDCATLLKYMGGHDELDSTSANIAIPEDLDDVDTKPKKLRIGIAKQYMSDEANDPAVASALVKAIEIYKAAGAEIVEVDLPHTEYGIPVYYIVATAEASSNLARYDGVHYGHRTQTPDDLVDLYARSRAEGFGDEVKRRIMLGTYALSSGYYDAYYNRSLKVRRLISNDFKTAFESCDAILCPTTTGPAFKLGEKKDDPLSMYLNDIYTVTANLAGIPGISMPAGTAEVDGKQMPIGMQLLGPAFEETSLLRIARIYEAATDYNLERPKM